MREPQTPSIVRLLLSRTLLAFGVLCLVYVVYVAIDARWFDWSEGRRFDEARAAKHAGQNGTPEPPGAPATQGWSSDRDVSSTVGPLPAGPQPNEGEVLGRIEIPRLEVSALLLEGIEDATLRHGAGHIPGTAGFEQPGNVGIAAHRDSFFRGLRNVRKGDKVQLTTLDGRFDYSVDWTQIVDPSNVGVLAPTGAPELTLVTCYPFYYVGSAPQRFIVRAHRVTTSAGS
jgi:LPXTG-site transpeptidase (sortase) family protein